MHSKAISWSLASALAKLYHSLLAHRQPSAPEHIGPYGGSYLDLNWKDANRR
jgi:hypothetical protein